MLVGRYISYFRRLPRWRRPRALTDKLLVRLLVDRSPRLTFFADKVAVREYVRDRLGGTEHLTTLYAVLDEPSKIRDLELPAQFVMKPNHLSHAVKIVNGTFVDRAELEALAASWFRRNYFYELGEWAYRNITPRLIFEELLDPEGGTLVDYKFHTFDGEPRFLSLISARFSGRQTIDIYDMEFQPFPVRFEDELVSVPQGTTPPPNWAQMLEIARTLAAGVGYVRVDLYNISGRIMFGELTNYPGAGLLKFTPRVWDRTFGDYWRRQ